ncbi:hypothetical protein [Microbacterium sp. NPDC055357]
MISDTAVIETWAKDHEISVRIPVTRAQDSPNRTPQMEVAVGDGLARCEVSRSFLWSAAEGSTLSLYCDGVYLDLAQLGEIDSITLISHG